MKKAILSTEVEMLSTSLWAPDLSPSSHEVWDVRAFELACLCVCAGHDLNPSKCFLLIPVAGRDQHGSGQSGASFGPEEESS